MPFKSAVWDHFTKCEANSAICNICNQKLSTLGSVSNLKKHLVRKHPTVSVDCAQEFRQQRIREEPTDAAKTSVEAGEDVDPVKGHRTAQQSWLWDFFEKIDGTQARCIICQQVYSYSSISNLSKHLDREHPTLACPDDGDQDEGTDGKEDSKSRRKSLVWNFFHRINAFKAQCNTCNGIYDHSTSTSNLRKHIEGKHPHISWPAEPGNTTLTNSEYVQRRNPRRSSVWRFFTRSESDKMSARCKLCGGAYSCAVSNLRKHLVSKHPLASQQAAVGIRYTCLKSEESSADERSDRHESPTDHQFTELYIEGPPQSPSPPPLPPAPAPRQRQHKQQLRQHSRKRGRSRGSRRADSTDSEDGAPRDRRRRRENGAEPGEDAIDQFGRYVMVLLRRLPPQVANRLQAELVTQIMQAQIECDSTYTTPQVEARRDGEMLHAENHNTSDPLPN